MESMKNVYVLERASEGEEYEESIFDNVSIMGIFSTYEAAERYILECYEQDKEDDLWDFDCDESMYNYNIRKATFIE